MNFLSRLGSVAVLGGIAFVFFGIPGLVVGGTVGILMWVFGGNGKTQPPQPNEQEPPVDQGN